MLHKNYTINTIISDLEKDGEQSLQLRPILEHRRRQLTKPTLYEWHQAENGRFQIDHTAATDRSRRCYGQILYLEHHRHRLVRRCNG